MGIKWFPIVPDHTLTIELECVLLEKVFYWLRFET
jgi:hypothetical protein